MKINAVSNRNYAQNNRNQNFKGLYFKEKTWQTIGENLNLKEIRAMNDAAKDVINLETLLGRDISEPVFEHLLLKLGDSGKNLKLLYEPFIDKQYTKYIAFDPWGSYEANRLYRYSLGCKFKILGYVPTLPQYSATYFKINGYVENADKKVSNLDFQFSEKDKSSFYVFASSTVDTEQVKNTLKENGVIPNEACPIPTKEFVREIVKKVYNYLLDENIAKMKNDEKAKLLDETKALRQQYTKEQLGDFIYTV